MRFSSISVTASSVVRKNRPIVLSSSSSKFLATNMISYLSPSTSLQTDVIIYSNKDRRGGFTIDRR